MRIISIAAQRGGWVVLAAAGRPGGPDFAVSSSGPGVSVAAQERYSLASAVELADRDRAVAEYDEFCALIADGDRHRAAEHLQRSNIGSRFGPFVADEDAWHLARALFGYGPLDSLHAITVPLLAIYGGDDRVVPVDDSIEALRRGVPEHLLEVCVLPGGDHRIQRFGTEQLVDGYAEALLSFIDTRVAVAGRASER